MDSFLLKEGQRPAVAAPAARPAESVAADLEGALVGSILGTAVGDALGLAAEGLSRRRQQALQPGPLRYRFFFGRGFCSDDTEHTCLVAQALIAARLGPGARLEERFAAELAWRLRYWFLGLPAGIGMATLKACLKLWLGYGPARSGVFSAGNGPAMRSALLGICCGQDGGLLLALVASNCRITHRDPRAYHGALAVALAAYHAACGRDQARQYCRALAELLGAPGAEMAEFARAAAASVARGEDSAGFAAALGCGKGVTGFVNHTVPVALHAWMSHPQDYRAALTSAIGCGGDTDTVAAIVGGIVGARVGKAGIPAEWLDRLCEWPRTPAWMEKLGQALALAMARGEARPAPRLNVLSLFLRNLFFLAVVLTHGLRRLLPPY